MSFDALSTEIVDNIFSYSIHRFLSLDAHHRRSDLKYKNLCNYASVSHWWRSTITSQLAREIGKLEEQSINNVFDSAVLRNRLMSLDAIYASGRASFLSSLGPSSIPGVLTTIEGKGLCLAAEIGSNTVIQRLIDQGVSANAVDIEGAGALHTSAAYGKVEAARLLLENGANVNLITTGGSRLHYAIRFRLFESGLPLVRLLLDCGADVSARDQDDGTPLHRAATEGLHNEAKLLLDNGAPIEAKQNDLTPLMIASRNRNAAVTRLLLERGADLNSALPDTGHDSLCLAVIGNRRRLPRRTQLVWTIKSLIEYGADVDGTTQEVPPLSLALMEDGGLQLATVEALLDANADIEKADVKGLTPLETWISISLWYDTRVLHLLLERGVNVNKLDNEHNSPLVRACAAAGGYSEEIQSSVIQKLIEYGADVNQANDSGDTPAMLVCMNSTLSGWQKYRLLQILLENGAKTWLENRCKETLETKAMRHFDLGTKERRKVMNLVLKAHERS